jgi:hypothetical protein
VVHAYRHVQDVSFRHEEAVPVGQQPALFLGEVGAEEGDPREVGEGEEEDEEEVGLPAVGDDAMGEDGSFGVQREQHLLGLLILPIVSSQLAHDAVLLFDDGAHLHPILGLELLLLVDQFIEGGAVLEAVSGLLLEEVDLLIFVEVVLEIA